MVTGGLEKSNINGYINRLNDYGLLNCHQLDEASNNRIWEWFLESDRIYEFNTLKRSDDGIRQINED